MGGSSASAKPIVIAGRCCWGEVRITRYLSLALALDDFVLQPQSMAHVLWYGTKSRNANARCILAQALGA